jgi:hypothetical protein
VPILIRPVREQIEHDRVIRQLQVKWQRRFRADMNPGDERNAPLKVGTAQFFPDLILTIEGAKKPTAVVEVETGESVNHLEAMSQWKTYAKSKIPLILFVPTNSLDTTRRLSTEHGIDVAELWSYHSIGEQVRFANVVRSATLDTTLDDLEKVDKYERPRRIERAADSETPGSAAAETASRSASRSSGKAEPTRPTALKPDVPRVTIVHQSVEPRVIALRNAAEKAAERAAIAKIRPLFTKPVSSRPSAWSAAAPVAAKPPAPIVAKPPVPAAALAPPQPPKPAAPAPKPAPAPALPIVSAPVATAKPASTPKPATNAKPTPTPNVATSAKPAPTNGAKPVANGAKTPIATKSVPKPTVAPKAPKPPAPAAKAVKKPAPKAAAKPSPKSSSSPRAARPAAAGRRPSPRPAAPAKRAAPVKRAAAATTRPARGVAKRAATRSSAKASPAAKRTRAQRRK